MATGTGPAPAAAPAGAWGRGGLGAANVRVQGLERVQVDGRVVLKILRHCAEFAPAPVTGELLGLDIGSTLEVTDVFPFPSESAVASEGELAGGADYQLSMMHCLREVNVDNNMVGMYMSSYLGSYQTEGLIETFLSYQESLTKCVCIVHDPTAVVERGVLSLKALRLSDAFVQFYKTSNFTAEKVREAGFKWDGIFEEIPLTVHNSSLVTALLATLDTGAASTTADAERLNLDVSASLEKNVEFLIDNLDDLGREAQVINQWQRQSFRNQQQRQAFLTKRRQENAARRAAGEEPLPEDDTPYRQVGPEPTRLSAYLIANEMDTFCNQVHGLASGALKKLSLANVLVGSGADAVSK